MVLDIALSTSRHVMTEWPPQAVVQPQEAAPHPTTQQLSANELYQRYLQGDKNTPFERVFNKTLREIDTNPPEVPAPWVALGQWAVLSARSPLRSYKTSHALLADVNYFIDPVESNNTEKDIIEAMVFAQGHGGVPRRGAPNLMGRPLLLKMPESGRARQLHERIMDGGHIAVRSLWGLGAQLHRPQPPKRLQVVRK